MRQLSHKFPNIYVEESGRQQALYTRTHIARPLFDERFKRDGSEQYRYFDPRRSKLCAALHKGISQVGIREGDSVLYLGASHGYTASFVADMVGASGAVFCVEFAPRVARDLYFACKAVPRMIPILADANHPEGYKGRITPVTVVYQDIAQRHQVAIFLKNCQAFLERGRFGLLALKSRSIDVAANPKDIYARVRAELERSVTVVDYRQLDPFELDHAFFVVKTR